MKILIVGAILLLTSDAAAKDLVLDHADRTQTVTIDFTEDLNVQIDGVNRYDYLYEVTVSGIAAKKAELPPFGPGFPTPDSGSAESGQANDLSTMLADTCKNKIDAANPQFARRAAFFDVAAWTAVNDVIKTLITVPAADPEAEAFLPSRVDPHRFRLNVDPTLLTRRARDAGRGGVLVITVRAAPTRIQADCETDLSGFAIHQTKAAPATDLITDVAKRLQVEKAINAHVEERVYRIHFREKARIRTAVGPFISGVRRTSYGIVVDPESDPTAPAYIVAETNSGDTSSGISVSWNVKFWRPGQALAVGLQWGLAFSVERKPDEAVLGLMGISIYPGSQETVFLSSGVALGRETELTGGWGTGDEIGPDQLVPTTSKFVNAWYLGMSFNF